VHDARPRFRVPEEEVARLADAFQRAIVSGDATKFAEVLAADAILYSDGGGKRAAALNPIYGRDKIVRFFEGVARGGGLMPTAVHQVQVNGLPGFVMVDRDGNIDTIATIDIRDGHVAAIYAVRNPDKLAHVSLSSLRGAAGAH
jgi:RNA polymerase sigma-70 factor (ECF subfamily)